MGWLSDAWNVRPEPCGFREPSRSSVDSAGVASSFDIIQQPLGRKSVENKRCQRGCPSRCHDRISAVVTGLRFARSSSGVSCKAVPQPFFKRPCHTGDGGRAATDHQIPPASTPANRAERWVLASPIFTCRVIVRMLLPRPGTDRDNSNCPTHMGEWSRYSPGQGASSLRHRLPVRDCPRR